VIGAETNILNILREIMLGKRSPQGTLFTVENRLRKKVGEESFYVFLSDHRHELFRDEDFAMLYCLDNGRESVPPSLLATALILQTFDRVADQEAADRAQFDQRWQVALGLSDEEVPFVKSTLCLFRNQLILHKEAKLIFHKGIEYLRKQGFVKRYKIRLALDTTPIFGKGAVEDTFNMLAEGLRQVLRVLAGLALQEPEEFARLHDFGRYAQPSFKGAWSINWDNEKERQTVLDSLVADCGRILSMARSTLKDYPAESQQANQILEASELLSKLLAQDVRRTDSGKAEIIDGVAKDRIVSVHDPEMRHGHKNATQRFDGYKASLSVETESQVIADIDVLPGNAHDNTNAPSLVAESAKNLDSPVEGVLGDGAYGSVEARLDAHAQGYTLTAPIGQLPQNGRFTKDDFVIDLKNQTVTCPAGQICSTAYEKRSTTKRGTTFKNKCFMFSVAQCGSCPLHSGCVQPDASRRTVSVHEHEELLQQAKAYQRTDEYRTIYRQRVVAEHRIARLIRLGVRKARYFGSTKVLFQLAMAAAVANLTLFIGSHFSGASFVLSLLIISMTAAIGLSRMTYRRFVAA
jgi:transposase